MAANPTAQAVPSTEIPRARRSRASSTRIERIVVRHVGAWHGCTEGDGLKVLRWYVRRNSRRSAPRCRTAHYGRPRPDADRGTATVQDRPVSGGLPHFVYDQNEPDFRHSYGCRPTDTVPGRLFLLRRVLHPQALRNVWRVLHLAISERPVFGSAFVVSISAYAADKGKAALYLPSLRAARPHSASRPDVG
jgi:hypothetical protein